MQRGVGDDTGIEPGITHIFDTRDFGTTLRTMDLHGINPWTVRRVTVELFPTCDGTLFQLLSTANDLEIATLVTVEDGQRQAPIAFLGDHPVIHVPQPVHLTIVTERRNPCDLAYHIHDLVAQFVH